jgi:hypothetical protein
LIALFLRGGGNYFLSQSANLGLETALNKTDKAYRKNAHSAEIISNQKSSNQPADLVSINMNAWLEIEALQIYQAIHSSSFKFSTIFQFF